MGYALVNLGRAIWMMDSVWRVVHVAQMAYNIGLFDPSGSKCTSINAGIFVVKIE
jgi:hypothetical protein